VPIIESVTGGRNIQQLVQVKGAELFFLGPADYSSSAGFRGQWEGPGVAAELQAIKDAIRSAGKHCGILAGTPEALRQRREQGFRMLGVGIDTGLVLQGLHRALESIGRDRQIVPALSAQ